MKEILAEPRSRPFAREIRIAISQEWYRALVVALAILALSLLPYALGYASSTPEQQFTGVLMNPEDSNSYLAKVQQGYAGQWLYEIPFTTEPHAPAFLGGFYLLLGQLARTLGLSVIPMWHLARLSLALAMFLLAFGFIRSSLREARTRIIAYTLALTGSGLGWLLFLFGQTDWLGFFPVDFKMPEAHLFFSALTFPHFAAGTALIVASLWLAWRGFESGQIRFALAAGVANLALGVVYPFLVYLIAAVLSLSILNLWIETRRLPLRAGILTALALAIPAPLYLYYSLVLQNNPVMRAWDAQAVTLSPNPLHYVVAYGPMLLLAAPTWRQRELRWPWLWVLAVALLVYAPLNPQRRFVEGVQIPLAILAAAGLSSYYLPRLRASRIFTTLASRPKYTLAGLERLVLLGLVSFLALSNVYILLSTSVTASLQHPDPLFRSEAEIRAVDWAGASLPPRAVILAAYETGNFIPTRTMLRTVMGHWAETMDWSLKMDEVKQFYSDDDTGDPWRRDLLARRAVDYVWFGARERALGDFDPETAPYLQQVYSDADVKVFKVVK